MESADHQGWLNKWTNYLKRYKKRWFVISNGFLMYYRNAVDRDSQRAPPCRGMWRLSDAWIHASSGTCTFVVTCGAKTLYLKATSEVEKLRWINSLEFAKNKAQTSQSAGKASSEQSESEFSTWTDEDDYARKRLTLDSSGDKQPQSTRADVTVPKHEDSRSRTDNAIPDFSLESKKIEAKFTSFDNSQSALLSSFANMARNALALDTECGQLQGQEAPISNEFAAKVHAIATEMSNLRADTATLGRCARDLIVAMQRLLARYDASLRRETSRCAQLNTIIEQLAREQDRFEQCATKQSRRDRSRDDEVDPSTNGHGNSENGDKLTSLSRSTALTLKRSNTIGACHPPGSSLAPNFETTSMSSEIDDVSLEDEMHFYDALDYDAAFEERQPEVMPPRQTAKGAAHGHVRSQSDWPNTLRTVTDCSGTSSTPPSPRLSSRHSTPQSEMNLATDKEVQKRALVPVGQVRQRRTSIPPRPQTGGSIWSILRQCVGKELTRIPIPVQFCEPLSILQRSSEDFEYTSLLDRAAGCSDPIEQMALVAAYSVSSYASTPLRLTKPFNPVLGETYELDRSGEPGYDWRLMSEQVSHHPPIMAMHCESRSAGWRSWMEIRLNTRFRAKAIYIEPLGLQYVEFRTGPLSGSCYTWNRAVTAVHNIIIGKLWLENIGDVEVIEHTRGFNCHLTYMPHSYFRHNTPHQVVGVVTDREGSPRYVIQGAWDSSLSGAFVLSDSSDADASSSSASSNLVVPDAQPSVINSVDLNAALQARASNKRPSVTSHNTPLRLSKTHTIWTAHPRLPNAERVYNFTKFSLELNESEPNVAPTDSRMRPDIRVMESGDFDGANREKYRIEEKQRALRRQRERQQKADPEHAEQYEPRPRWFESRIDPITNKPVHVFTDKYWIAKANRDWTGCPDLF